MGVPLPQRVPGNAPGDFYVENGGCMRCCLPHGEAPDLMNDPNLPFEQCFFLRQPRTPEEVDAAIQAMRVSEVAALRYGGRDPEVLDKMRKMGCEYLCDQTQAGRDYLARVAAARGK
jgi:hypothetical protein